MYQALAALQGHKNSYGLDITFNISQFFFKTTMENGSCTHHFSVNNQYHFFCFLKASCPCVSIHLGMEILAVSSRFSSVFEFLLLQTVHCVFHCTGLKYDNYTTHRISLTSNLKNSYLLGMIPYLCENPEHHCVPVEWIVWKILFPLGTVANPEK